MSPNNNIIIWMDNDQHMYLSKFAHGQSLVFPYGFLGEVSMIGLYRPDADIAEYSSYTVTQQLLLTRKLGEAERIEMPNLTKMTLTCV